MPVPGLLDEAAARMNEAAQRIEEARSRRAGTESQRAWLAALTDFAVALADVQRFSNESVHEKLHELAGRGGLKAFPSEHAAGPSEHH